MKNARLKNLNSRHNRSHRNGLGDYTDYKKNNKSFETATNSQNKIIVNKLNFLYNGHKLTSMMIDKDKGHKLPQPLYGKFKNMKFVNKR